MGALDQKGQPHIIHPYSSGTNSLLNSRQLHYTTKFNGKWVTEGVDPVGQHDGADRSIALDSHGHPHTTGVLREWESSRNEGPPLGSDSWTRRPRKRTWPASRAACHVKARCSRYSQPASSVSFVDQKTRPLRVLHPS